jgi:hypothetical protein
MLNSLNRTVKLPYTHKRVLQLLNGAIIFVSVFHRILDFKRGWMSIQTPFLFLSQNDPGTFLMKIH